MCPQPPLDSLINPCLTLSALAAYTTGLVTTLISLSLVLIILRARPKTTAHYYLVLYIITNTLVISIAGSLAVLAGNPWLFLSNLSFFYPLSILMFSSFYWFVHAYLKIKEKLIVIASLVYLFGHLIAYAFNPYFMARGAHWSPLLGYFEFELSPKAVWFGSLGLLFLFLGLCQLFLNYRQSHSVIERNRLKYLTSAPLLHLVGLILIASPQTHIFPFDMVFATIAAILLTAAILRYQLLDINVVIRKGLFYSSLTAVITALYLLFSFFLQLLYQRSDPLVSFPAGLSTAIFVALIFQPLQTNTQAFIDRLFFRRRYDPQALVVRLSQIFAKTLDLNLLSDQLLEQLSQTLQVDQAALFLLDEKEDVLILQSIKNLSLKAKEITLETTSPLVRLLSQSDQVRLKSELEEKKLSLDSLDQTPLEIFIPLRSQGRLRGLLCLGRKLSQELYSVEELDLLVIIAHSATLALDKAFLFHQLTQEKDRVENARLQLENKVKELERFYKLAVGRELRMVELKKEINQLKGKT